MKTHCSPVNEEIVKVHEHPSGLFGVGLLVEVSIEVAQLREQNIKNQNKIGTAESPKQQDFVLRQVKLSSHS